MPSNSLCEESPGERQRGSLKAWCWTQMLVLCIQPRGSVDSPGNMECILWDTLFSLSHANSTLAGAAWLQMVTTHRPQGTSPRNMQVHMILGTCWIWLIMFHYPYPPAARFTVLFLEWQIRKLFILNDSRGKNQVANFPEGVLTDRGWRPRVICLKRYDLKVIL